MSTGLSNTKHFLQIEGLSREHLQSLLAAAKNNLAVADQRVARKDTLAGRVIANLFFEDSTRTRCSFETAVHRLGGEVFTLAASGSSASKGESLVDTALNIEAMGVSGLVIRSTISGGPAMVAKRVSIPVINAGDGRHAHPTQGLLDAYTIRHFKKDFSNLRVAIVGDVLHSRVARSDIHAFTTLGCAEVRVVGPRTLIPSDLSQLGVKVFYNLEEGIRDCDVVIALRLQNERMSGALLPSSQEYFKNFGLTTARLQAAKPDAIVMHPGPINRGVEIESAVVDGPQSVILNQVTFGIAVRMAVMSIVAGNDA